MVVNGPHVLGCQVSKRQQNHAKDFLDKAFVAFSHTMGEDIDASKQEKTQPDQLRLKLGR